MDHSSGFSRGSLPADGGFGGLMDDDQDSQIPDTSYFDYLVMSPEGDLEEIDQNQSFQATNMQKQVSGSSMESRLSLAWSLDTNDLATSPLSSLPSPQSEETFSRHRSVTEQPQISFLSPEIATISKHSLQALPTFNIEVDGDPNIQWFMYYDFVVTKTEAYYQLQPGYVPTDKYRPRINSENVITEDGEKRYPCRVPDCKAKPFTRHYDLERHFATIHRSSKEQSSEQQIIKDQNSKEQIAEDQSKDIHRRCDYKRCKHTFRKDHCREHYREYHSEDLIRKQTKSKSKTKSSNKKPETVKEFLAARISNLKLGWWRCSKCLQRVAVNSNGYTCPECNLACEPERVKCRENAGNSSNKTPASGLAATDSTMGCGLCENAWVPDDNDVSLWISCSTCRPGVREEMRSE